MYTNQDALASWKRLRVSIASLPLEQQVQGIVEFIAAIPYGSPAIDLHTPSTWPTPWEILAHQQFCPSTISILAYHTLTMVADTITTVDLIEDGTDKYLVTAVDGMVINYYPRCVISRDEMLKQVSIICTYDSSDITSMR